MAELAENAMADGQYVFPTTTVKLGDVTYDPAAGDNQLIALAGPAITAADVTFVVGS